MTLVLITSNGVVRNPAKAPLTPPKRVDRTVVIVLTLLMLLLLLVLESVVDVGVEAVVEGTKWCWYCLKAS